MNQQRWSLRMNTKTSIIITFKTKASQNILTIKIGYREIAIISLVRWSRNHKLDWSKSIYKTHKTTYQFQLLIAYWRHLTSVTWFSMLRRFSLLSKSSSRINSSKTHKVERLGLTMCLTIGCVIKKWIIHYCKYHFPDRTKSC